MRGTCRSARRGAAFWEAARATFLVGAYALPSFWGVAAASMVVGEVAEFEVEARAAFGDARVVDDVARAAMATALGFAYDVDAGDDVVLELEVLAAAPSAACPVVDASGGLGRGQVLKHVTAPGRGWRRPTARSDCAYDVVEHAVSRWARYRWAGGPSSTVRIH